MKSDAMLGYECAERDLFQRLVDGEITMVDYQMGAADALQEFMHGFSTYELLVPRADHLAIQPVQANIVYFNELHC
jgi:hypothetical protein